MTVACGRRSQRSAQMSPLEPEAASLDGPSSDGNTAGERERMKNGRVIVHL